MTDDRLFLVIGAVSAGLGVAFGAFGAHGLEGAVTPDRLDAYETGARYQLFHALGLLAVGLALRQGVGAKLRWTGWLFAAGTVLFSGSLYALVLLDVAALGIVTPFGGACFIVGWALFALAAWRAP
jgi:uncharacterized membrane protein YgdD (TMEM256/DUF423 family)